jgi:putative endonuclease
VAEFPPGSTRDIGQRAETIAAVELERAGLSIVERNVDAAGGEIDLIARGHDGRAELFVFVEVRSRGRTDLGHPLETVGAKKRSHLVRAAKSWLVTHDLLDRVAVRFDVIGVSPGPDEQTPLIEWIEGAFEAEA